MYRQSHQTRQYDRAIAISLVWLAAVFANGCYAETADVENAPAEPQVVETQTATTAEAQGPVPATPASTDQPAIPYLDRLSGALDQAENAKDAIAKKLYDATQSGGQAASDSMAWATEMYNNLKTRGLTTASDTQQWLASDWKNAGAWEYKTLTATSASTVERELNELGAERWECFHVAGAVAGKQTFYLKRPVHSYLNNLPMKDVMHLLPIIGAGKAAADR